MATSPLRAVTRPVPEPGLCEVRVEVRACGVCRTDLHLAEGDLAPKAPGMVPGHEVVGVVNALGPGCTRLGIGERVGVAWLAWTCGECPYCLSGRENLCERARFTGWDRDGGFAEQLVSNEAFVYKIPENLTDLEAAPLLCAGIIGYRALCRAALPSGGSLGIYGYGASAHLTAQIAHARGARVHVVTRSAKARALALSLGADSATETGALPPEPLDAALLFAPSGELVRGALEALAPGGTLVVAGIHLSTIPALDYDRHLFAERDLRSVTANTRADGEELLALAASTSVRPHVEPWSLGRADEALAALAAGRISGVAVLQAT